MILNTFSNGYTIGFIVDENIYIVYKEDDEKEEVFEFDTYLQAYGFCAVMYY